MEYLGPDYFINRELSWLAFNDRVIEQAQTADLPIYERLRFLGISASNLDEFFMVRVAGLVRQVKGGVVDTPADGLMPDEQLRAINAEARRLLGALDRVYLEEIKPGLAAANVHVLTPSDLDEEQLEVAHEAFLRDALPALTPIALDPGHPFPHLRSKSINVALRLRRRGPGKRRRLPGRLSALVQVPSVLSRVVRVPHETGRAFVLLEDLIARYAHTLFPGFVAEEAATFRVTRNWDFEVDEEEAEDLLAAVQEELRRRDRGAAVRLEVETEASPSITEWLQDALHLGEGAVFRMRSPMQPQDLMVLADGDLRRELQNEPFVPAIPAPFLDGDPIFETLRERDVLLHHPYESFDPVVRFISDAAEDPKVLAIKQTFYRTSGDSPFVRALARAAENGKQVVALVEIKARFDEENNIEWARRLEEAGVHVVYGLVGLKTHCKAALVVRREDRGIRSYVHLGTGNYNPQTARHYTDLSFMSAKPEIVEDVAALFNMLTGLSDAPPFNKLLVAPIDLEGGILRFVEREITRARRGEAAQIRAKMNSLVDPVAIRALYRASQAGVKIDLLIRGICCLRPGIPDISENIRVISVIDRFLEHSRVFVFGADGREDVFLSSADWMPRNFRRRVEAMFPVEDKALKARVLHEVFHLGLTDNQSAWQLEASGRYVASTVGKRPVRSQMAAASAAKDAAVPTADNSTDELRPKRPKRQRRDDVKKNKKRGRV